MEYHIKCATVYAHNLDAAATVQHGSFTLLGMVFALRCINMLLQGCRCHKESALWMAAGGVDDAQWQSGEHLLAGLPSPLAPGCCINLRLMACQ